MKIMQDHQFGESYRAMEGFPGGTIVRNPPAMQETRVLSLGQDPLGDERQPTPVFLLGKSHGWRSLTGYSPRGRKEWATTERLHFLSLSNY